MKPKGLKKGDTIGVIAQSEPITDECIEEIQKSVKLIENLGINVKFSKHVYDNPTGYGGTAKNKAEDINEMFKDKTINRNILCNGRV